jgi:Rrf2 family protein
MTLNRETGGMTLALTTPLSNIVSRKELLLIVAVVDVAIHGREQPVRTRDVAARHSSRARFFEPLLQILAGCGILRSKRGRNGGYRLARDPRRITVADLMHAARGAEEKVAGRQNAIERLVSRTLEAAVDGLSEASLGITIQDLVESAESLNVPQGKARRGRSRQ